MCVCVCKGLAVFPEGNLPLAGIAVVFLAVGPGERQLCVGVEPAAGYFVFKFVPELAPHTFTGTHHSH